MSPVTVDGVTYYPATALQGTLCGGCVARRSTSLPDAVYKRRENLCEKLQPCDANIFIFESKYIIRRLKGEL